jgi:predicted transposase YdaD
MLDRPAFCCIIRAAANTAQNEIKNKRMKKPKPYDQAFKYLAEEDPRALFVLLGILKPDQKARIKLLPNEVAVSAKLPDSTYLVTLETGEQRLVHIEAQTVYDPQIQRRMAEYAMRLWIKYGLPVDSYLLLLTPRKVPTPIPHQFRLRAGGLEVRLQYQVVPLWKLSARQALKLKRQDLLPFIPLMKGGMREVETGVSLIAEISDEKKQSEIGLYFIVLGGLRYTHTELLEIFGRTNMITYEHVKDSSVLRYLTREARKEGRTKGLAEGLTKGIKEGIKEGIAKGRAEGRAAAIAELLTIAVRQRFPKIEIAEQLKQISDADTLQALFLELNGIKTSKAFLQRLTELISNQNTPVRKAQKNGTSKK